MVFYGQQLFYCITPINEEPLLISFQCIRNIRGPRNRIYLVVRFKWILMKMRVGGSDTPEQNGQKDITRKTNSHMKKLKTLMASD